MPWRDWLGVGERRWKKAPDEEVQPAKTLWDWLQLLIVPAILIGVTFAWSASQSRSNNKREDRHSQDATLQAYLNQMSGLMLHEKLLTPTERFSAVRQVGHTVTLTTLRRLNGERRVEVVSFLYDARLLVADQPVLRLNGADLEGVHFDNYDLTDVGLAGADLTDATFANSRLIRADLGAATLVGAHLASADLSGANLVGADLTGADLTGANLERSGLAYTVLEGARLNGAALKQADMTYAHLKDAELAHADLRYADLAGADLEGAKLASAKLNLGRFIADLPPARRKVFLDSQQAFLDSLSRKELARFKLSAEKLAKFRREASGH